MESCFGLVFALGTFFGQNWRFSINDKVPRSVTGHPVYELYGLYRLYGLNRLYGLYILYRLTRLYSWKSFQACLWWLLVFC